MRGPDPSLFRSMCQLDSLKYEGIKIRRIRCSSRLLRCCVSHHAPTESIFLNLFPHSSLPELLEKKRLIDQHTNIATALLDQIKVRILIDICTDMEFIVVYVEPVTADSDKQFVYLQVVLVISVSLWQIMTPSVFLIYVSICQCRYAFACACACARARVCARAPAPEHVCIHMCICMHTKHVCNEKQLFSACMYLLFTSGQRYQTTST